MSIRRPQPRGVQIPVLVRVTDRNGKPQGPPMKGRLGASLPLSGGRGTYMQLTDPELSFHVSAGPETTGLRVEPARLWLRVTGDARWDMDGAGPAVYGSECEGVTVNQVLEAWHTAAKNHAYWRRESAERERKEAEALAASKAESERRRREAEERVCRHQHESRPFVCSRDRGHDGYHFGRTTEWSGVPIEAHWDDESKFHNPERERQAAEYRERCRRAEAMACPSVYPGRGWCLNSRGHDGLHRGLGGVWSDADAAQAADATTAEA